MKTICFLVVRKPGLLSSQSFSRYVPEPGEARKSALAKCHTLLTSLEQPVRRGAANNGALAKGCKEGGVATQTQTVDPGNAMTAHSLAISVGAVLEGLRVPQERRLHLCLLCI